MLIPILLSPLIDCISKVHAVGWSFIPYCSGNEERKENLPDFSSESFFCGMSSTCLISVFHVKYSLCRPSSPCIVMQMNEVQIEVFSSVFLLCCTCFSFRSLCSRSKVGFLGISAIMIEFTINLGPIQDWLLQKRRSDEKTRINLCLETLP